jgi:hypothetical protein
LFFLLARAISPSLVRLDASYGRCTFVVAYWYKESPNKSQNTGVWGLHEAQLRAMRVVCFLVISAFAGVAQEKSSVSRPPVNVESQFRLWKVSAATLVAASAADIASSFGKCCESNPILASSNRTFGARGVAVKTGSLGGQLLLQYIVARRSPKIAKVLSFVNFAGAGALTAVAVRNYRIQQPLSVR